MRIKVVPVAVVCALTLAVAAFATPATGRDSDGGPQVRRAVARVSGRPVDHAPRPFRASLSDPRTSAIGAKLGRVAGADVTDGTGGRAPAAPVVLSGFDGIGDIDNTTPADPTGALGDTWFFTAINVSWALFDRAGTPVLGPEPLTSVDPSLTGEFVFDPKIVYDQYNDTFVLAFLLVDFSPRRSRIVVTTIPNATANDTTTWCTTIVKGDQLAGDGAQWADYPGLGYTTDRVTVTTNQFGFGEDFPFRYAQILSFDKTELYDCTVADPSVDVLSGGRTRNLDGTPAFTLQPAQTVGVAGTDQFLLSFEPRGRRSFNTIWRVRPTATGVSLKKATIQTGATKPPLLALQGGAPDPFDPDFWWDAGDFRLVNAFYDADRNRLYSAHTVRKNFRPDIMFDGYIEAAIRWYEIEPADSLRASDLLRKGVIGESEVELGWPVVATDELGNLFVTYNRASFTFDEFLSAWIATIPPGSRTPSELVLVAGEGLYDVSRGPERWGDFNAIGRDPVLGTVVFAINQYATATNRFQQSVHTTQEV
jgi:hypothetical protein